jgi:hypothetical protein
MGIQSHMPTALILQSVYFGFDSKDDSKLEEFLKDKIQINPSTPRSEARSKLRVDTERRS